MNDTITFVVVKKIIWINGGFIIKWQLVIIRDNYF